MEQKPTFGVVLPSQRLAHEATRELAYELRGAGVAAAEAGAETIWVWDHMLKAPVYQGSWHDPLVSLGVVADLGVRLGTGVLVAPVRPPVQTAMAVASLQALSGQRMRYGVGTGWNPAEFAAAGTELKKRGALADEFIAVTESIFAGEEQFSGRFWNYEGVVTGHIGEAPEIWIAGGSRAAGGGDLGPEEKLRTATMAPAVARRILKQGRWVLRPTAEFSDYQRDVDGFVDALGDPDAMRQIRTSIIVPIHIVETDDPEAARAVQYPVFAANLVSDKRPPDYINARYLLGTLSEIRTRLQRWIDVGLEHIGLYLLGDVPRQVELLENHFSDMFAKSGESAAIRQPIA
jgi:alkanesulfonate monooxygenase SsuD/methylene tetrahydromethanopterin reductase-like flavin-dependent oxidoreductase (luciferase family)